MTKDRMNNELDDFDLEGEDAPDERGEAGEYVQYLKAKGVLETRLGATPAEIAMWTWLGRELHGKPAGGINGYRDPALHDDRPLRFHFQEDLNGTFDYLGQLMACYYRIEDIDSFEPEDRYLTFDRVVSRFRRFCSESEARSLIHIKVGTGELESYHPQTGMTAGTHGLGEEPGFPPLEQGLFTLADVHAIEAECTGQVTRSCSLPADNGFISLNELIDGSWDLPLAELTKEQRQIVLDRVAPFAWDHLSPERRQLLADQLDYQRDPALQEERARTFDEEVVDWKYWGALHTLLASEFVALRNVCDPRQLDSRRDVFPGGERPSLGQRVDDDLRRIAADPAVSKKERLTLRQWMHWAQRAGLECPRFMRAHLASVATTVAAPEKKGITRREFINKHAKYVDGQATYLKVWFDGRSHARDEKPEAAAFRIPGAHGRYDEEAMVAALKAKGRYSQLR